jgi:hypothetical protein
MMLRKDLTACYSYITKSELSNHQRNSMYIFLSLILGIDLLTPTIMMINLQAYSSETNSTSSTAGVTQMGICLVGAGGPCNGDSNWDGTHDVTGQCVLLNGCGSDNGNNNNKSTNNGVNGK